VTSVGIQMGAMTAASLDTTYLYPVNGQQRTLTLPQPGVTGATPNVSTVVGRYWPRNLPFIATLAYTGGPITGATLASVPYDLAYACHLITAHFLGYRRNPTGAAMIHQGDFNLEARLRGDTSGKSLLLIDAEAAPQPYKNLPGM
jgi:hypothetical protein